MSGLMKKPIGSYAHMANGPLAKPDGMRGPAMAYLRKMSLPVAFGLIGFGGVSYYYLVHKLWKQTENAFRSSKTPDALFEEIKEYGVYQNIKASWQEE